MEPRINPFQNETAMKVFKHIGAAGQAVINSKLPASTRELVNLRASQINGCGYCTDMHAKDLAHAGETAARINLVATWREATVFTPAERAALELTEQGTRIADGAGGVTDDAWADVVANFDEEEVGALLAQISIINSFNRFNVINKQPAGDYQPGQAHSA
ncbi:carboxymuconolactone decarboxylase family protein [Nocardioidaceae bacterium SCSIO 66511]|nr:carboxymuconolactone decarboxylase family protein [Nocardioidaceae bacterium SCSIO 66511]